MALRLSEQQLNYFHTFGFLILRNHIPQGAFMRIRYEFDLSMKALESSPPANDLRSRRNRFFMDADVPAIAALAANDRFAGVAEQLLKRPAICIHVAGTRFVGDTPWHSDNYDLDYHGVKFACYFDALDASNGAIRLLPGSHRDPMWRCVVFLQYPEKSLGVMPQEMPAYVFESRPGDVLAFHQRLWHASLNGGGDRRMLELNYYANPRNKSEREAFRAQMQMNHEESSLRGEQMYPVYWRNLESKHHQRWCRRLRELGVMDTPVVLPSSPPVDA